MGTLTVLKKQQGLVLHASSVVGSTSRAWHDFAAQNLCLKIESGWQWEPLARPRVAAVTT